MRTTTTFFALSILLGGCSSGYSSGVSSDKPVSTLSASEAALACENLSDFLLETVPRSAQDEFNCYVQALSDVTGTPEVCNAAFTACMAAPPTTPLNVMPIDCTGATPDATCNATVGETEDCISADAAAYTQRLSEVNCSAAGNVPELTRLAGPVLLPPECSRLSGTCPNVARGIVPR